MGSGGHWGTGSDEDSPLHARRHTIQNPLSKSLIVIAIVVLAFNLVQLAAPQKLPGMSAGQFTALFNLLVLGTGLIFLLYAGWKQPTARELTELLDMLPMGAALWSPQGQLLHCNETMRQQFDLEDSAEATETLRICDPASRAETPESSSEFELERENGQYLHVTALNLTDGSRLSVAKDITDHRHIKLQLARSLAENRLLTQRFQEQALRAEAASRSKSAFLAHLSHDIRTPLNHIIGFAELIRQESFGHLGNPRYHAYLDDIKSSGERLLDSFAEVLELAELDSGRREIRSEPVQAKILFEQIEQRFGAAAARAGIALDFGGADDSWILGDAEPLCRMLGNLVDNALRFTPRGGRVKIVAWESGSEAVLEVTDTGTGIAPQKIAELSQPFVLGDAAFTRSHGGLGLGLAISRSIAELSGGRLEIDSTPPLGTTVAVSLPRAVAGQASNAA